MKQHSIRIMQIQAKITRSRRTPPNQTAVDEVRTSFRTFKEKENVAREVTKYKKQILDILNEAKEIHEQIQDLKKQIGDEYRVWSTSPSREKGKKAEDIIAVMQNRPKEFERPLTVQNVEHVKEVLTTKIEQMTTQTEDLIKFVTRRKYAMIGSVKSTTFGESCERSTRRNP